MKMIPYEADYIVACNSNDKGAVTKKNCSVGCIGCKLCEKKSPDGGFIVEDYLARIDYTATGERLNAAQVCPPKCIILNTVEVVKRIHKKLKLIFGTYNSKPVGSYDYQFEESYQSLTKPFDPFKRVSRCSGSVVLLETFLNGLKKSTPDYHAVKRHGGQQVEIIGGGFYEPPPMILERTGRAD